MFLRFVDYIYECMPKKKLVDEHETYILPAINDEMESFIGKFKIDMMYHIVDSIEYAIEHKLNMIELFSFKKSDFVITLSEKEFDNNLSHIKEYYQKLQLFELCPRIEELQKLLKNKI